MAVKKILILNRAIDQGGIDVVGTELAKFLAANGYEAHLAVLFEGDRKKVLPKVQIHSFSVPPSSSYIQKFLNLYRRFDSFRTLTKELQPDAVIAEGNVPCIIVGLDKKFGASYQAIMTAHNIMSRDLRGPVGKLELLALKFIAKSANLWVAVSSAVGEDTEALLSVNNVDVVYNAVSSPKKPSQEIPEDFIFSAGRITAQKDFPTLIRAFRIVADRHPKLKLLIAGAPEPGQEKFKTDLETLIKSIDLKGQVVLLGQVSNVSDYLSSAKFFVLSSIYEGMPIIALEALGLGKAVVATEVPGTKEAVGSAGLFSPIGDEVALAKNISRLLSDRALQKELESKAKDQAKKFSPAEVNKPWLKILENL